MGAGANVLLIAFASVLIANGIPNLKWDAARLARLLTAQDSRQPLFPVGLPLRGVRLQTAAIGEQRFELLHPPLESYHHRSPPSGARYFWFLACSSAAMRIARSSTTIDSLARSSRPRATRAFTVADVVVSASSLKST